MVWSLEEIREIEDRRLLAGHIAMFLQMFDKAQVTIVVQLWKKKVFSFVFSGKEHMMLPG